jgi:ribosome maturation factor RimP
VVDGDGPDGTGPLLDDIAEASKSVSAALDRADVTGNSHYTLEVSSRGVTRPLVEPRHWRRNVGRLVEVRTHEGRTISGRIVSTVEEAAVLEVDRVRTAVPFTDVATALVQVEFNRSAGRED